MATNETVLGKWEQLGNASLANPLPIRTEERDELLILVGDLRTLTRRQSAETATKQQTTKEMQEKFKRGQVLAERLRTAIRAVYGSDSEKLVEFGLHPRRPQARSTRAAKQAAAQGSAARLTPSE